MSRQPSAVWGQAKPWGRPIGSHPLAGALGGGASLPLPLSQPEVSMGRPAPSSRPTGSVGLPRFSQQQQQQSGRTQQQLQGAHAHRPMQAPQAAPLLVGTQPQSMLRLSQQLPAASHGHAGFAPWSQRSQMDNILLAGTGGGEEEQTSGENNPLSQEALGPLAAPAPVVGSAPQQQLTHHRAATADAGAGVPCSQEVTLPAAPAQTAAKLLNEIARTGGLACQGAQEAHDSAKLGKLSAKLSTVEGLQTALAAAVGGLKADVAAQGAAVHGIGQACQQLLQAVQAVTAASGTIQEGLQALAAREQPPVRVTGDMAVQTSPWLAAKPVAVAAIQTSPVPVPAPAVEATQTSPLQAAVQPAPAPAMPAPAAALPAAAAEPEHAGILRSFNQRRPSSAAPSLLPPKPAAPRPASAAKPARGLASSAGPAAGAPAKPVPLAPAPAPAKPTTSARPAQRVPAKPAAQPAAQQEEACRRSTRLAKGERRRYVDEPLLPEEQEQQPAVRASQHQQPGRARRQSAASDAGAADLLLQLGRGSGSGKAAGASAGTGSKPPAAPSPPASFGRKRSLLPAKQQGPGVEEEEAPPAKQQKRQLQPSTKQAGRARPPSASRPLQKQKQQQAPPASQAEALFDSLFGSPEEQEQEEPEAGPPAAPSRSGGDSDLAGAVQRQMERHQARMAQRRKAAGGSGTQLTDL